MSTSFHNISAEIAKELSQSNLNYNKKSQPTHTIVCNVYPSAINIINTNVNVVTPSNIPTENTILGTEKMSEQCEDEKCYDRVDGDDSNKLGRKSSIACSIQNCDEKDLEDVGKKFASTSLRENRVENIEDPDLILNSTAVNESEVLENVSVKTDNGFNDEKKLMNGTEVLKNVFVKTDDGLNDQTLSYEELLNSITNKNEKAAAEKILNSPLKDLTNTAKLFEMINTENHGLAINDIINSDDLDLTEQDKVQINLAFVGGGDPAQKFIETLVQEQPKLPISDLENALKTNNVCYDKLTNSDETISNLKYNWIKSLCVKLNFDSKWRNVASTLGYTQQKIISFQLSQKRENNYSQAERLFSTIQHRKPNLSVKGFMDILHSLNQENIYQHMIIMVKQAAKKVTVPIGNQETSKNNQD